MSYQQMPWLKEDEALTEILSRDEIARLLDHCESPKHKAIFALAYGYRTAGGYQSLFKIF